MEKIFDGLEGGVSGLGCHFPSLFSIRDSLMAPYVSFDDLDLICKTNSRINTYIGSWHETSLVWCNQTIINLVPRVLVWLVWLEL